MPKQRRRLTDERTMPCMYRICAGICSFLCCGQSSDKNTENEKRRFFDVYSWILTYFAVFELVTVPMTLKWVSLTTAACIWAGLMIITVIVAIICAVKKKTKDKYSKNLPDAAGISGDITPKKGNSISDIWKRHSIRSLSQVL